jgi:hypothetical protein
MEPVEGEKRGLKRFDLEIPARIRVTSSERKERALDLLTTDISSGGAYFHTSQPLSEGTDVKIDLILPLDKLIKRLEKGEKDYKHAYIRISGKVLRTESRGMAIIFGQDYEITPWHGAKAVEH